MNKENSVINLSKELQIDKELEKIWFNRYANEDVVAPLFPEKLLSNCITYLSLNPPLQPKDREDAKKGNSPDSYQMIDWKKKAGHPFFKKMYKLGETFSPWTFMDLLYERNTIEKEIELKYKPKHITDKDKIFLQSQIKLTFKVLETLKPLLVVVANRISIYFIHQNFIDLGFKSEIPTNKNGYIYRINGIPFITEESAFFGRKFLKEDSTKIKTLTEEMKRILNHPMP